MEKSVEFTFKSPFTSPLTTWGEGDGEGSGLDTSTSSNADLFLRHRTTAELFRRLPLTIFAHL